MVRGAGRSQMVYARDRRLSGDRRPCLLGPALPGRQSREEAGALRGEGSLAD